MDYKNILPLLLLAATATATATATAAGQGGAEYRAPTTPVDWVSDNPFRLYLLRGGDTIGDPVRAISVFRESWSPAADGFDVVRASSDLGFSTRIHTDTLTVTPRGRVLRINGRVDHDRGEWDALLRLPTVPLRVGLEWSDTLSHPTTGPAGPGVFEVRRSYRVARELAAADSVGYEVAIAGHVRFGLSMWTDSVAGQYRWFELEGPMEERFVFDPASGQLHRRTWSMLLQGIGGDHDGTRTDTVPAGLRSRNSRYRIPEARAAALIADLPGADTALSVGGDGGLLFAHTFGRDSGRVLEGLRRADGLVARAEVSVSSARPDRWTFTFAEPASDPRSFVYERRDDALVLDGRRLQAPVDDWGVAEHGMFGTLLPSLEALPEPEAAPFAVYRPTPGEWEVVRVTKRSLPEAALFVLVHESGSQSAILVDGNGGLLYEEVTNGDGSQRIRFPASEARQQEVRRAIAALQGGS